MDISIIIVNTNTKDDLRVCLGSISKVFTTSKLDHEIFVVDNNSIDGSQKMVKKEFPSVILIENQKNLGFSKANNQAIRMAKGDYLLLLNPDTVVMPKSLDLMVEFMKKNKEVGILTPQLLGSNGLVQPSTSPFPNLSMVFLRFCLPRIFLSPKIKNFIAKSKFRKFLGTQANSYFLTPNLNSPIEVDTASGSCLLVRREAIERVGLLDENFFMYSEDIDWCFRIKKAGWKIIYFPGAKIIHFGGKSTGGEYSSFSFCRRIQSVHYYFKKHYDRKTTFKVKVLLLFALIRKMPQFLFYHFFKNQNKSPDLLKIYWTTFKKIITG